jgi:hypothetical protein
MKTKKLRIVIFSLAAIVLVKVSLNLLNSSITTQSESSIFQSITSLMDTLRTKSYCDDPNDLLYQGFHAGMNEANFNKELQVNPNINQGKITMYFGVNDQISLEIKPTFNTRNCLNYLELQYNGRFDALGAIIRLNMVLNLLFRALVNTYIHTRRVRSSLSLRIMKFSQLRHQQKNTLARQ